MRISSSSGKSSSIRLETCSGDHLLGKHLQHIGPKGASGIELAGFWPFRLLPRIKLGVPRIVGSLHPRKLASDGRPADVHFIGNLLVGAPDIEKGRDKAAVLVCQALLGRCSCARGRAARGVHCKHHPIRRAVHSAPLENGTTPDPGPPCALPDRITRAKPLFDRRPIIDRVFSHCTTSFPCVQ